MRREREREVAKTVRLMITGQSTWNSHCTRLIRIDGSGSSSGAYTRIMSPG